MILITLIVVALICIGCYAIGYSDGKCDAKLRCNDLLNDSFQLYMKDINRLTEEMMKLQKSQVNEVYNKVNHLNPDDPIVMAYKMMLKEEEHNQH